MSMIAVKGYTAGQDVEEGKEVSYKLEEMRRQSVPFARFPYLGSKKAGDDFFIRFNNHKGWASIVIKYDRELLELISLPPLSIG